MLRSSQIIIAFFIIALCPLTAWSTPVLYAADMDASIASARKAGVPENVITRLLAAGLEGRMKQDEVIRLVGLLETAGREGLPLEGISGKVEEGLAKRVPAGRILLVIQARLDDYRFARDLVDRAKGSAKLADEIRNEYITTIAESLALGLSREDATGFIGKYSNAPLDMLIHALENLALLRRLGFDKDYTDKMLNTGLEKKALSGDWRFLFRGVVNARDVGLSDSEIGDALLAGLGKGESLAKAMTRLGFTERNTRSGPGDYQSERNNN